MTESRDDIIRRRHANGQHHKQQWLARTAAALASELGVHASGLKEAVRRGEPAWRVTREMLDYATPLIAEGAEHYRLYVADSPQSLRHEFHIGEHTFRRIIAEGGQQEPDPVRRFLTMRLTTGEPA